MDASMAAHSNPSSSRSKKPSFPLSSSPPPPFSGEPTCRKLPISSLLASAFSGSSSSGGSSSTAAGRKTPFKASTFRGLGCRSVAEVSAPETVVRASADWQGKSVRKKKPKKKKPGSAGSGVVAPDVWCTPGVGFAADVDCVVARRPAGNLSGRGRADCEVAAGAGERCCSSRRGVHDSEQVFHDHDSPLSLETARPVSEILPSAHFRRFQGSHRSPGGLSEIIMFQTGFLLGTSDRFDEYSDLRIDVDNMSYEELLELGDKIGYVSTGLKEEEIMNCLRKTKNSIFDALPSALSAAAEIKCSICQEEYEVTEDVRKLGCGHSYHLSCIKQWLQQKNACPVCKLAATEY